MCVDIAGGALFDWNCVKFVKNHFSRIWFPADGYGKTSATISRWVRKVFSVTIQNLAPRDMKGWRKNFCNHSRMVTKDPSVTISYPTTWPSFGWLRKVNIRNHPKYSMVTENLLSPVKRGISMVTEGLLQPLSASVPTFWMVTKGLP